MSELDTDALVQQLVEKCLDIAERDATEAQEAVFQVVDAEINSWTDKEVEEFLIERDDLIMETERVSSFNDLWDGSKSRQDFIERLNKSLAVEVLSHMVRIIIDPPKDP